MNSSCIHVDPVQFGSSPGNLLLVPRPILIDLVKSLYVWIEYKTDVGMDISEETKLQEEQYDVTGSRSILFASIDIYSNLTETSRCVFRALHSKAKSVTEISI